MALRILFPLFLILFIGCGIEPKTPDLSVGINGFRMVRSKTIVPKFEIDLHLVNSSPFDLKIEGVVYKVYLGGRKIVTGAAHDLPKISAYSEANIKVMATPDLFESLSFFKDMMDTLRKKVDYNVDVTIDVGKYLPRIHTKKRGEITLF